MSRPNIMIILNDDMGFSDLACYGGEIHTPNLDRLASGGLRFTQFYNTARCCPSRASLLTGLYPHQADVGHMMDDDGIDGYLGDLNANTVTIAEALRPAGYATYMSGKWHVTRHTEDPKHNWPCQRGFDEFYGIITGASNFFNPSTLTRNNERIETPEGDYFLTDAISEEASRQIRDHVSNQSGSPFFSYVAYTAPHWPLHAHPEDIDRYAGRFDAGWDTLREERLERMTDMGLLDEQWSLTPRDPTQPPWDEAEHKAWHCRRMEVYAAQVDRMDRGIGRIIQTLEDTGQLDQTLIFFLADNGGCAEEISPQFKHYVLGRIAHEVTRDGKPVQIGNDPAVMPGGEETYQSYGVPWANLSNTPFREYKHWVHEGGIATPLIVHWPAGITEKGTMRGQPGQLPDIMATCLDVAGAPYPETYNGQNIQPAEGYSMRSIFDGQPSERAVLYWEHEGNKAVRRDNWKLVCKYPGDWELYNMTDDRTELHDISEHFPEIVSDLSTLYEAWAARCQVMPWSDVLSLREQKQN